MKGICVFLKTKENYYLYELYNNSIYKISDLAYKVIPLLLKGNSADTIKNRFNEQFSKKRLNDFLNNYPKEGIFGHLLKDLPPIKFLNPLYYKNNLEQYDYSLHHVVLDLTDNCNLRCKYCAFSDLYPTEKKYSTASMSYDIARRAVKFLQSHSTRSKDIAISFYGGEPLIKFNLIKKVVSYVKRIFKKKGISFHMTTNGTLLNKNICRFLIKNNFHLLISLDGPRDVHDRYRVYIDGKGSFDSVIKGINILKSMDEKYFKKNIIFNAVIGPHYKFKDIANFFINELSISPHKISTNFVRRINTKFYEKFPESANDRYDHLKLYSEFVQDRKKHTNPPFDFYSITLLQLIFLNIFKRPYGNIYKSDIYPTGQCLPGLKKLYIDTNGNFHMCERIEHTYPIGDIYKGYNMERINKLLNEYYDDAAKTCGKCWAMRLCELCMIEVLKNGRFDKENKRRFCIKERRILKKYLASYCSILEENPKAFDYMKKIKIA